MKAVLRGKLIALCASKKRMERAYTNILTVQISHIIGHKTDLNRYKKIELIPCILSDHQGVRLIFNSNKNNRKSTYTWKLNNALLNETLVKEKIRKEIRLFRMLLKMKIQHT